jgi:hypothetical protein
MLIADLLFAFLNNKCAICFNCLNNIPSRIMEPKTDRLKPNLDPQGISELIFM